MPQREQVSETARVRLGEADASGRFQVTLITPGWGSSGYYSPQVLEAAATAQVFPAGTQMFINHQTAEERMERPAGDLLLLAGRLEEDAVWDGSGLTAPATIFSDWRPFLTERAGAIGVSIRAAADIEVGEADGRRGHIVTDIVYGESVDFVTSAGRGGTFQVLEQALPSRVLRRVTARGVTEATANDLREQLQAVLRDAYGQAEDTWIYVRDFDPAAGTVWYQLETPTDDELLQHDFTVDAGAVTLSGAPVEVRVETRYVPVNPAGQPTSTEESHMPQIEESRLAQLEEAAGRVQAAEAERDEARRALAEANARNAARPIVTAVLAESTLVDAVDQAELVEQLVTAAPLTDAGALDETALRTRAVAARTAAEARVARYLQSAGDGVPRGLGDTGTAGSGDVSESQLQAENARAFGRPVKEA